MAASTSASASAHDGVRGWGCFLYLRQIQLKSGLYDMRNLECIANDKINRPIFLHKDEGNFDPLKPMPFRAMMRTARDFQPVSCYGPFESPRPGSVIIIYYGICHHHQIWCKPSKSIMALAIIYNMGVSQDTGPPNHPK